MHFHWQNLNTKGDMSVKGFALRHGRCWLALGEYTYNSPSLQFEWLFGDLSCGTGLDIGGEEKDFALYVQVPLLFSFYFTFSNIFKKGSWLEKHLPRVLSSDGSFSYRITRRTGLRVFDKAIWWDLWNYDDVWSSTDPWWMRGCWHPLDTLLGRQQYSKRELSRKDRLPVPMPEGNYHANVVLHEATWQRKRWPFPKRIVRADVEVCEEGGIPVPGKGTAAYNCGPSAIFSLTTPATSPSDAVSALVKSALRDRERYPL